MLRRSIFAVVAVAAALSPSAADAAFVRIDSATQVVYSGDTTGEQLRITGTAAKNAFSYERTDGATMTITDNVQGSPNPRITAAAGAPRRSPAPTAPTRPRSRRSSCSPAPAAATTW